MLSRPECKTWAAIAWTRGLLTIYSQLQSGAATGAEAYTGMVDCFSKIIKTEGYARIFMSLT